MNRAAVLGTAAGVAKIVVRIVCGLITFRLVYGHLDAAAFGFYALIWSLIGLTVLLDFGFGQSVVRAIAQAGRAAEAAARARITAVAATVFWTSIVIAALATLVAFLVVPPLVESLVQRTPGADPAQFRQAALIFIAAVGLAFPFGMFREALIGQQRIAICHGIDIACTIASALVVSLGCAFGWGLVGIVAATASCFLAQVLITAGVALRQPWLRPHPRDASLRTLREISSFSLVIYLTTLASIIATQTELALVGGMLSLEALALYAPGQRLAQLYGMLVGQLHGTLAPLAATEHRAPAAAGALFLRAQRWTALCACSLVLPMACDLDGALRLLTGIAAVDPLLHQVAALLLIATALGLAGSSSARSILVLIGGHRLLLGVHLAEGCLRLGLGVLLMRDFGLIGMAIAVLAAQGVVSLLLLPLLAAERLQLTLTTLLRRAWLPGLIGSSTGLCAGIAWAGALPFIAAWAPDLNRTLLFFAGAAWIGLCMLPGWWCFGLAADERADLRARWQRLRSGL